MNRKSFLSQSTMGSMGRWWGAFRNLGQYVAFYITFANFFMIFMSWYVIVNPYLQKIGIILPFWFFALVLFFGLLAAMFFEHKFTLPSYFTYWNSQWWTHGNPLADKIQKMQEQLDRIEQKLKK